MPRKQRIEFAGAVYHIISRGNYRKDLFVNPKTAEAFEKAIFEVTERCGWKLYAYVIMSNHYHLVVHLDPKRTEQWTDREVVDRWLNRTTAKGSKSKDIMKERMNSLINRPQKVAEIRARLGSLSWFMREINEPMARIAAGGGPTKTAPAAATASAKSAFSDRKP